MDNRYRYCCIAIVLIIITALVRCASLWSPDTQSVEEASTVVVSDPPKQKIVNTLPVNAQKYSHLFEDFENPSRSMAQMWVESKGNQYAESPYGGLGLMQFTQPTVDTAQRSYCAHLGEGDPMDPYWAVPCSEAMNQYMDIEPFDNYCDNKAVDECRYNGGWWCVWELRAAPIMSFESAESICGVDILPNGRRRSIRACAENYAYRHHISRYQPLFSEMGGKICN